MKLQRFGQMKGCRTCASAPIPYRLRCHRRTVTVAGVNDGVPHSSTFGS